MFRCFEQGQPCIRILGHGVYIIVPTKWASRVGLMERASLGKGTGYIICDLGREWSDRDKGN